MRSWFKVGVELRERTTYVLSRKGSEHERLQLAIGDNTL